MAFLDKLAVVLKYSAADAVNVEGDTPEGHLLSTLANNILAGETDSIHPLVDKLYENDHPLAPIIQKLFTDQMLPYKPGIWTKSARSYKKYPDDEEESFFYPYHSFVWPKREASAPKAGMTISYHNHPSGYLWEVSIEKNKFRPEGSRSYQIPTNPEEVNQVADKYDEMAAHGPPQEAAMRKAFADHLRRTVKLAPGETDRNVPVK